MWNCCAKTIPPKPSPAERFAVHKRGARGGGGPSERQNPPRIRIAMGHGVGSSLPSDPERRMVVLLCGKYHRTQRNQKNHHNKSHSKKCCVLCAVYVFVWVQCQFKTGRRNKSAPQRGVPAPSGGEDHRDARCPG